MNKNKEGQGPFTLDQPVREDVSEEDIVAET